MRGSDNSDLCNGLPYNDNDRSGGIEDLLGRLHVGEGDDEGRIRPLSTTSFEMYDFRNVETWRDLNFALPLYGIEDRRYYLPVAEDDEAMRQEIVHTYWAMFDHLVPPRLPSGTFLDLGTGAGYWVQDVAQNFPQHKVIGIDLHYSERLETGINGEFEVDDCEAELFPRSEPVSLINLRDSYFWIHNMSRIIHQARSLLQPGGYFQNQEFRLVYWETNKAKFTQWRQEVLLCAESLGVQLHSAEEVRNVLGMAGFQDYQEHTELIRITKSENSWLFQFLELTVQATLRILVDGRTTTLTSRSALLDEVLTELAEEDCWVIIQMHSCWARK